jgi:hypothetical protein
MFECKWFDEMSDVKGKKCSMIEEIGGRVDRTSFITCFRGWRKERCLESFDEFGILSIILNYPEMSSHDLNTIY